MKNHLPFEIYMVHVKWNSEYSMEIYEGIKSNIEYIDSDDKFICEIPIYYRENNKDMQIAVKAYNKEDKFYIIDKEQKLPMINTEMWWIADGEWNNKKGYRDSDSFNRIGTFEIVCKSKNVEYKCAIYSYYHSLSLEEYQQILEDFSDDCRLLLVDPDTYVTISGKGKVAVPSQELLTHAQLFITSVSKLLQVPHAELRETQSIQLAHRVRPTARTFMELSVKGNTQKLSGRTHTENYNTNENGYVAEMVNRVLCFFESLRKKLNHDIQNKNKRIENLRSKINHMNIKINCDEVAARITSLREQHNNRIKKWKEQRLKTFILKTYDWDSYYECFYGSIDEDDDLMIKFENCSISSNIKKNRTYKLIGNYSKKNINNGFQEVYITQAYFYHDMNETANQLDNQLKNLIKSGGTRNLTDEENDEQDSIILKSDILKDTLPVLQRALSDLQSINNRLSKIQKKMSRLKIKRQQQFIPSMIFLQHPHYANALITFRKIFGKTDEMLFKEIEKLVEFGIHEWPVVYERWCMLQILIILKNELNFTPIDPDWTTKAVKHCINKEMQSFEIRLHNENLKTHAVLYCQPSMKANMENRRPDFMLEFKPYNLNNTKNVRLIIDAKSCDFIPRGQDDNMTNEYKFLDDCLVNLLNNRKYHLCKFPNEEENSENEQYKNIVFAIHSSNKPILNPTTEFPWAYNSTYGGSIHFRNSQLLENPNHHYGAVMLRPSETDHLHRLLAMILQYFVLTTKREFCINCGMKIEKEHKIAPRGNFPTYKCDCGHLFVSSRCGCCGNQLWKNGESWTYHDTSPLSIWNIRCPNCGQLIAN